MSGIVACRSCRQRKRRCDKGLPACGLCRRMGRVCEYQLDSVDPAPSATTAEIEALRNRLDRMERRLASGPTTTNTTTPSSDNGSYSSWPLSTSAAPSVTAHQFDLQNDPSVPTTALFLDLDVFVWARCSLPPPNISAVPIPTDILTVLTQGGSVVDASNNYFSTVHQWLPFISRRRMDLGFSIREAGPELAMLFFSMKLITTKIEDDANTDTGAHYLSAKRFLDTLQLNNAVSLICLQSMILVALYEFSHAVYPAAWMTLGACARYAEILGLSCSEAKTSPLNPPMSWTEAEERRRAWWVIFVLDRLLSAGGRRSFLLPDPPLEGRLPGNDGAWESGDVREAVGFPVSTDKHVPQYNFARLCQSAIYIGRCVDCARSQRSGSRSSTFIDEVSSLIEELNDFASLLDSATEDPGKGPFTNPLAPSFLARSSLFILLDVLTCPEKVSSDAGYAVSPRAKSDDELALQHRAMTLVQTVSQDICEMSHSILARGDTGALSVVSPDPRVTEEFCPFILDAIYAAAVTYRWLQREGATSNFLCQQNIETLEAVLELIGSRWRLGKAYSGMLSLYDSIP